MASGVKADEDEETKRIVKAIHEMKEQMAAESAQLAALREDKRKCQVNDDETSWKWFNLTRSLRRDT